MRYINYIYKINNKLEKVGKPGIIRIEQMEDISYIKEISDVVHSGEKIYYDYYIFVKKANDMYLIQTIKYMQTLSQEATDFVVSLYLNYVYAVVNGMISILPDINKILTFVGCFQGLYDGCFDKEIEKIKRWKIEGKGNIEEPSEEIDVCDVLTAGWYKKYIP